MTKCPLSLPNCFGQSTAVSNGLHWSEIEKLREKVHSLSNLVAAHHVDLDGLPEKVAAHDAAINRFRGMIAAASVLAGAVGALVAKLLS